MKLYRKMCRPIYSESTYQGYIGKKEPLDDWYPEEEEQKLREKYEPMYDWNKVWARLTFEYKYVEWEEQEMMEELDLRQPKKIVGKLISTDVFDKIRAEIEQIADEEQKHDEKWAMGLRYAVKIIDKYKAESE